MAALSFLDVGYVIHSRIYKENSLLIDFFTLNHGRISAIARSAKSIKNGKKAVLQPFTPLELTLKAGRGDLYYLDDCTAKDKNREIKLPNLFCATYLNELLYYLFKVQEPTPRLFASYIKALDNIRSDRDVTVTLRTFEFTLLEALGYGIDFLDNKGRALDDRLYYMYTHSEGFYECTYNELALQGSLLNTVARHEFYSKESLNLAKQLCSNALKSLLGTKIIKSRIMYQDYLTLAGKQ